MQRFAGVVLAVGVLVAGGCGGTSDELAALREDPMADVELESGERIAHRETDAGEALGKPVHAKITQTFVPRGEHALGSVLEEAVNQGKAAGWDLEPGTTADFFVAERRVGDGSALLEVYITDTTDPPRVVVRQTLR